MSIGKKLAEEFFAELDSLRNEMGQNIEIGDIDEMFEELKRSKKRNIYNEISGIAGIISTTKSEIVHIGDAYIGDANQELEAIVKHTEESANQIMDSAEALQEIASKISDEEISQKIGNEVINIFEASNFQDITGQRITKVINALLDIEEHISHLLGIFSGQDVDFSKVKNTKSRDDRPDADLMNGPQLENEAPSQDDIDKMFS